MKEDEIGSGPIEPQYVEQMKEVAMYVHQVLNGPVPIGAGKTGFVLLVFPFGHSGRCNYLSTACREDVIVLLKEQLAYFSGQPETQGKA